MVITLEDSVRRAPATTVGLLRPCRRHWSREVLTRRPAVQVSSAACSAALAPPQSFLRRSKWVRVTMRALHEERAPRAP